MPRYTAFTLNIDLPFEAPELISQTGGSDISVRFGRTPDTLVNPLQNGVVYQATENEFLLSLHGIADYYVKNGNEIIIHADPNVSLKEIRLFLFSTCLAALLHQRGILLMHAAAFQNENGAVLLTGHSSVGKSTLVAEFIWRGYKLLADDLCGVVLDDKRNPLVLPAFPQIKLWKNMLDYLGMESTALTAVRPQLAKYSWFVHDRFCTTPVPLHAAYILSTHNKSGYIFESIQNTDKFKTFLYHTFQHRFLDGFQMRDNHFKLISACAQKVRIAKIVRPHIPVQIAALADRVEKDLQA